MDFLKDALSIIAGRADSLRRDEAAAGTRRSLVGFDLFRNISDLEKSAKELGRAFRFDFQEIVHVLLETVLTLFHKVRVLVTP